MTELEQKLTERLEKAKVVFKEKDAKEKELIAEVETLKARLEELQNSTVSIQSEPVVDTKYEELQSEYDTYKEESTNLYEKLQKEFETIKLEGAGKLAAANAETTTLTEENAELKTQLAECNTNIQQLNMVNNKLNEEAAKYVETINNLTGQVANASNEISSLKERLTNAVAEYTKLKNAYENATSDESFNTEIDKVLETAKETLIKAAAETRKTRAQYIPNGLHGASPFSGDMNMQI